MTGQPHSDQNDCFPSRVVVRGSSGGLVNCEFIDGNPHHVKVRMPVYEATKGLRYEERWIDADDVVEVER